MSNTVLFRYLAISSRNALHRISASTGLILAVTAGALLTIGSFFYFLGSIDPNPQLLSFSWLALFLIGLWSGMRYATAFRPSGWQWLRQSNWFWLTILLPIAVALLLGSVTVVPYYLANLQPVVSLASVEIKLILLLLNLAIVFLGLASAVAIRRLTYNPYVRLTLLVMIGYLAAVWLLGDIPSVIHHALASRSTDILLIGLLLATGILGASLLLLQLALDGLRLSHHPAYQFWTPTARVRLLKQSHHPAISYFLTRWTFYGRSSQLQRRVAVFFLLVLALPYLVASLSLMALPTFAIQLGLVWFLAYTLAVGSSQSSRWLKSLPVTVRHGLIDRIALLLLVVVLTIAANELFLVREIVVTLLAAICVALVVFTAAEATIVQRQQSSQTRFQADRIGLLGLIVSVAFVVLPLILLPIASTLTTVVVMLIWLGGVTLQKNISRRLTWSAS